jgi:hypothetical protein
VTKRLQVLLDERELREMQRVARAERMTLAEWVRQALRNARRQTPSSAAEDKLDAIRRAVRHGFPTADIEQMTAEIERGYSRKARR